MTHGHKHRKAYQQRADLTGEHAVSDIGQLVLACLFAATWIADSFFLKYTIFLNNHVPPAIRIPLAVVVLGISACLAWTGMSMVFGETRDDPGVIRTGVFGIVRHPIYLSEVLLYLGFLMLSLSLAAAVVWCIALVFLHYISRWEEKLLLARFGEEYAQYMRDVPMWIPHLRKR
jgi:protein-S-isoprenylcysteine O-methyltransferase Ste14